MNESAVEQARDVVGDIHLKAWPQLTGDSIGEGLSAETVQEILGIDYPVTAEKSQYAAEWKYTWASPDKTERGSVTVTLMLDDIAEEQMVIQAGVRRNMVEQGSGEEADLGDFGVIGVHRTMRNTNDLQVCTKHKLIVIETDNMRGRDFADDEAKKKAAADLARALFQAHAK